MNTQRWLSTWEKVKNLAPIVPLTAGILIATTTAQALAQSVVVVNQGIPYGVIQSPPVTSYIYGSPIPTPMPVNPTNGLLPSSNYYPYPAYPVRRTTVNSTLFNPVLVNPTIKNSTLVNPVIVNDQFYQTPVLRRSGIIFNYPY